MPILADNSLVERKAPALSSNESRAACVHLALQYRDDSRDKGLTKLCFEALVRAVLRDTTPTARLSRREIRDRVASLVPATSRDRADVLTDGALGRLERRGLRRWRQEDEFCLSHEERERIRQAVVEMELAELELLEAIDWEVGRTHEAFEQRIPSNVRQLSMCVRTAVETVLLRQGEAFAAAVATDEPLQARAPDIEAATHEAMTKCGLRPDDKEGVSAEMLRATCHIVLTEPAEPVQEFFRAFADAYTLFAFLRETPDVQSAVLKMFSVGEIWLDTTVVLPLFAETLVEDSGRRRFTNMFRAAHECGLTLRITEGVLEEVEAHTWNATKYARQPDQWLNRVPFLAGTFVLAGNSLSGFGSWMEAFRGRRNAMEDLAEYLQEEHAITVGALAAHADKAAPELRAAVQEVWQEAHERRRSGQMDAETTGRLVRHDLENYLGVVQKRRMEARTHFGYKTWWLTLDSTAYGARQKLWAQFGENAPDSPIMSPDFMVSYLTIGPLRAQLNKASEAKLPLSIADLGPAENLPRALITQAEELRGELHGKDDRVIRRILRERSDLQRRRIGARARGGMGLVRRELEGDVAEPAVIRSSSREDAG